MSAYARATKKMLIQYSEKNALEALKQYYIRGEYEVIVNTEVGAAPFREVQTVAGQFYY